MVNWRNIPFTLVTKWLQVKSPGYINYAHVGEVSASILPMQTEMD